MIYKLYLNIKIRGTVVEEQIQQILSYVQGGFADVQKKNILKDLEGGSLEYETAGEFSVDIKKEFGGEDKETVKVAELKIIEQGGKTMEKFIQKFRRVVTGSEYERKLLVEEFKRGINRTIYQKLMKSEWQPISIE